MNELEVGKIYVNGKLSREITKIDGYEIYYKTESGKEKNCFITTFQDWVAKGLRGAKPQFKYEITYTIDKTNFTTTKDILDIEEAKRIADELKKTVHVTGVSIIEFKTTQRIIEV